MKIGSSTVDTTAEDKIRELGRRHGIGSSRTQLDDWVDKIGELSGQTEGSADEVEQILINLRRASLISVRESQELLLDYLDTKFGYG